LKRSHYLAVRAVNFFYKFGIKVFPYLLKEGHMHHPPPSDLVLLEFCSAVVNKGFHFVEHLHVICSLENALKINFSLPSFVTRSNAVSSKYNVILCYGLDQMKRCNMQD